jgi:hypothetical protein
MDKNQERQNLTKDVDAFYGFQLNKRFYVVLCQDGLPSHIGKKIVDEILKGYKSKKFESWKKKLLESKIVFEDSIPTKEDLQKFKSMINKNYDGSNWTFLDEFYIQNKSLEMILQLGIILNSISPQGNPYVAPYGYVLNFDDNRFDIYIEHARVTSLEDRYGTLIPVLKEKISLDSLSCETFQKVIDKYENGICESESESDTEETDFETDHSESSVEYII